MPLPKGSPASAWVHDFVHSDAPQFKGKSKKKRIQMALAAKYANEETMEKMEESVEDLKNDPKKRYVAKLIHDIVKRSHEMKKGTHNRKQSPKDINRRKRDLEAYKDWDNHSESYDMSINEYKYGSTHEFRGATGFMKEHAEKILKKHGIQIHSIEELPDEKETIYHVSGSVESLNDASADFYSASNGNKVLKPTKYTPPKFQGMIKKIVSEETEMEKTNKNEVTVEDILAEGPHDLLNAIANDDPEADNIFAAVMGAKIDVMLNSLKNEIAAGMFETQEEEVELTAEDFLAACEDVGIELTEELDELTEEQIDEISDEIKKRYAAALPMSIAKNAGNAVEAGHIKRPDLQKKFEHRALKRVGKAAEMLSKVKHLKAKPAEPEKKSAKKGKK